MDILAEGCSVTVEWRPYKGFGITRRGEHGFGEGPAEVASGLESALERVASLLTGEARGAEPRTYSLTDLRKFMRMDQSELARRIDITQAALSKIERRPGRSQLVTLIKFLKGLGARLELSAIVPDQGSFRLVLDEQEHAKASKS
jgi:DNA-binding XRE family transcriptional regulator